jgi:hypothetical protein
MRAATMAQVTIGVFIIGELVWAEKCRFLILDENED